MESVGSSIGSESSQVALETDGALCEQEYETQYFGFTPKSFCDGIYNAAIEYILDDLELVQKYIAQEFPDVMTEDLLRNASETLLLTFIKAFDKAFDKLEVYLVSNILHIPNNVILPEDSIHTGTNYTEEDEETVDADIEALRKKIKYAKYLNACLKHELLETEKITSVYEAAVKRFEMLERVVSESGVSELKESLSFTVSKVKKLHNILQSLPEITNEQVKRTAEEETEARSKKIKPASEGTALPTDIN